MERNMIMKLQKGNLGRSSKAVLADICRNGRGIHFRGRYDEGLAVVGDVSCLMSIVLGY
jgi:hypothetical protein